MARHTEHNTSKIYPVAEAFRANCLLRDDSLLHSASEAVTKIRALIVPMASERSAWRAQA